MNDAIYQVPAEMTKVETRPNRSLRIHLDTQENISVEMMEKTMRTYGKTGWFTFSEEQVKAEDLIDLPPLTFEKGEKSKSVRLRGVLFRLWEKTDRAMSSEEYYNVMMEKIIENFKNKLD